MNWYIEALKNYAVFTGRATRRAYWMFILVNTIIHIVLALIGAAIGSGPLAHIDAVYGLALLIPGIAAGVRRLHDADRSGWWLLLPLVNIVFLCFRSTPGDNRFGPAPTPAPAA